MEGNAPGKTRFNMQPARLPIPSLPAWPLLGNILALRKQRLALLQRISREFGDIGAFHFGTRLVPLLNSPDLVREALVERAALVEKTATVRALAEPVLGNGVFLSEGEEHRRQRRLLAPLFQQGRVLDYAETIVKYAVRLQESWREGELVDIAGEMTRLALWIIGDVLFGADVSGEESELGAALTYTFQHFASALTNPLRPPLSWPTPGNLRARRSLARVNAMLARLIKERRQREEERPDFLSLMLRARDDDQTLSERQARDEALSLFVAGHETTAIALTWSWYLLSQHPEIYARVQDEVDQALRRRPTVADLPNLPYTLQVWKEAVRLYPPVYAFTRRATAPLQLGPYSIARGTSIVISPYTLHRRPHLFPDPERFDPARFSPQEEERRPRYAYLPFGAGPHICLGMHLALLESHLILTTLARHVTFEFAGPHPVQPQPLLTLRPEGAVLMRVRRR